VASNVHSRVLGFRILQLPRISLAERLKADGVKVWFDEWDIKPGDSIPAKIEDGLEKSRVLVLCMSANAFGSDWAQLESGTFRFRDPLNKERRFPRSPGYTRSPPPSVVARSM